MQDVADVAEILEGNYIFAGEGKGLNGLNISPHHTTIVADSAVADVALAQLLLHQGLDLGNAVLRVLAATHDKVHVALARLPAPRSRCRAGRGRVLVQDRRNLLNRLGQCAAVEVYFLDELCFAVRSRPPLYPRGRA